MKQVDAIFGKLSVDLESAFFLDADKKAIEKMRILQNLAETKENLRAVSGIQNESVLNRLVELDIKPDVVASLAIIPIIEVAWADGSISEKERLAVLQAAADSGMGTEENSRILIEQWLSHKPEPKLIQAWSVYVEGLCELLTDTDRISLKEELVGKAKAIAEASGGFLGIGKISSAEKSMLEELEAAFSK